MTGRYVVLGLAPPRAEWFRAVDRWANSGGMPLEFVKCVSAEEIRARLSSGRVYSALLADGTLPAVDRDLIAAARDAAVPVLVVDDRGLRDWRMLGASGVLPSTLDRRDLVGLIAACATPVSDAAAATPTLDEPHSASTRGPVVAVCGPGGTGVSTCAIAAAQGLAASSDVVLADLTRHGEQAMLHDCRDVLPALPDLVEAFRAGAPTDTEVRASTFHVPARGYSLLLGLRRSRSWSTIRPRSFETAFAGLGRAFGVTVCDVDADVEGEAEGGSIDVEERNVMARTAMASATAVLVVGSPGMKGVHALARVAGDLLTYGVEPGRLVPVLNRAPRSRRARAEMAAALGAVMPRWGAVAPASPVFVPERDVDGALRDGVPLPPAVAQPVSGAIRAVLSREGTPLREAEAATRVRPGTLPAWSPAEAVG